MGKGNATAPVRPFPRGAPPLFAGRTHLPARHPRGGRGQRGWLVPGAPGPRSGGRRRVGAGGLRGDGRVSRPAARLLRRRQPLPPAPAPRSVPHASAGTRSTPPSRDPEPASRQRALPSWSRAGIPAAPLTVKLPAAILGPGVKSAGSRGAERVLSPGRHVGFGQPRPSRRGHFGAGQRRVAGGAWKSPLRGSVPRARRSPRVAAARSCRPVRVRCVRAVRVVTPRAAGSRVP